MSGPLRWPTPSPFRNPLLGRVAKFGIVGVTGTGVYYLTLMAFVEWMGVGVMLATSICFLLVVLQNYILHHRWTFESDSPHRKALPQFFAMSAVGFAINWIVMYTGVRLLGFRYLLVQLVAIALVVAWNWSISHLLVFRERVGALEPTVLGSAESGASPRHQGNRNA